MGTISRASGTPYVDGDVLPGARLEGDISALYGAVNGNIEAVNLKNGAVTAAKIGSGAVGEANLANGAAGLVSEATSDNTGTLTSVSGVTVATTTHQVGLLGNPIIIIFSCAVTGAQNSTALTLQLKKDGTSILGSGVVDTVGNGSTGPANFMVNRTWIDAAPTAGGTHTYAVVVTQSTGQGTTKNAALAAIEIRR